MRKFVVFCTLLLIIEYINAQTIENPVFDRSDVPEFHIEKVVITQDTTYIYCFYEAEAESWARVSKDMYLEDANSGAKLPLLKASGLPYAPLKRDFLFNETIQVLLCFPHINTDKFNLIEEEGERAFNIYGINISESYTSRYEASDYWRFNKMSEFYKLANNDNKFLEFEEKELSAAQYLFGSRSLPASECYRQLSEFYNRLGLYLNAINLGLQELECDSILYGVDNKEFPVYPFTLVTLASYYQNAEKDSLALECEKKCIRIWKNMENEERYLNEILNLVLSGRDSTGIIKRIGIAQKELDSLPSYINNYSIIATIQKNIAQGHFVLNDYRNAIKYCDRALTILKNAEMSSSMDFAEILSLKCKCQRTCGKIKEAISSGEAAMFLFDYLNVKSSKYLELLNDLSRAYKMNYDYETSIMLLRKAICISEEDEEWISLADSYESISDSYQELYDFDNAEIYAKKAIEVIDNHSDVTQYVQNEYGDSVVDSLILNEIKKLIFLTQVESRERLARIYENRGKLADAISTEKEVGIICESSGDKYWYAMYLSTLSEFYLADRQYDNAIECAEQSFVILKEEEKDVANPIMQLSLIYGKSGDYEKAIQYMNESLKLISDDVDDKISILSGLAFMYYKNRDMTKAEQILSDLLDNLKNKICNESAEMTSEQKQRLWDKYQHNFLSYRNVVKESEHTANMFSKLYDCILFSKNFLLDTDVSKDVTYINPLLITWKDIQRVLSEDDIAIEFLATTQEEREGFTYSALVIDKNCMSPQMIELYNDSDTEIDFQTGGEKIWNPILNKFKKVRNIYFSPDFFFHVCPIEYLIVGDSVLMSEKYNIYRLSSTKELLKKKNKSEQNSAVLYGGLEYNQATYFAQEDATKSTSSMLRSISERGGFEPLYNTMDEVNEINSLLSSKQVSTSLLVGNEGTEESFRKLSNMDVSILHLATHGMYIEPENVYSERQRNNFEFLESLNNEKNPVKEDITLTHSFLVMSGGNKLIQRDMESNDDDGILTAKEISQANLTGVDLVVLSACESALGDINSGGVYGLQRGFKKAGANTILMSVIKVDDEATRILMVEFYRNLLSGKSKLQSLKDAQQHLRKYENGKYIDYKYWGSFIMLDGID